MEELQNTTFYSFIELFSALLVSLRIPIYPPLLLLDFKKTRKKESTEAAEVICKHYGEKGHKMKTNRKCKLYTESSKGEHVYDAVPLVIQDLHLYHVQTLEEILVSRFGRNFERYTRTVSLSEILVMDMEITNTNDKMPNDIRDCLDRFKTQYLSAIFTQASIRGYANPLARACQTLQTTYSNMIVEHFQDRVEKFVIFKLQRLIPVKLHKCSNEYIYEDLAGGNPTIPEELQEDCDLDIILAIHTIQISLKDYIPEPCTTEMAANPWKVHSCVAFYTIAVYTGARAGKREDLQDLAKIICSNATTIIALAACGHRYSNFGNTSSFGNLQLSDFKEEIENYFMPCALDPGRRDIFQAAYGAQNTEHEIRRTSTREYYQWAGSPKRIENLKKTRKRNGIEEIESKFPSAKNADITRYSEYVRYLFLHLETLFTFYCFHNDAERRFRAYQGKQRAQEELVNVIVNGGKKYDSAKRKHRMRNRRERKK
ncbi:hypothetical protein VTP01DRAFT_9833 [Rhizomucor pusillus]|uniref:uncharacterized protein n=1 Tax=Rhizomucor pusillus TaxID=4840 RepID=UPI0037437B5A